MRSLALGAYLALCIPGAPSSASTHKPESSASVKMCVKRFASLAFISEFASKVEKVYVIEENVTVDTIPVAEKIQKVLSFYNLGKSHLCKITGISRPALYAWIDGSSEPVTENFIKVEQLYSIARELDVTGKATIHHGFVDKALPGEEKSLYQLFVENSKLDIASIKNLVQVALNKSISRAENIESRRVSEFKISHSDADKELNLERNL